MCATASSTDAAAMTISHVTIVSIPVADQDRAKAFYMDALGLELLRDEPMGPTMRGSICARAAGKPR